MGPGRRTGDSVARRTHEPATRLSNQRSDDYVPFLACTRITRQKAYYDTEVSFGVLRHDINLSTA